jgi:hypothetical protein
MVRQMRAVDTYGTYDSWPLSRILALFVLTKEHKRDIPKVYRDLEVAPKQGRPPILS